MYSSDYPSQGRTTKSQQRQRYKGHDIDMSLSSSRQKNQRGIANKGGSSEYNSSARPSRMGAHHNINIQEKSEEASSYAAAGLHSNVSMSQHDVLASPKGSRRTADSFGIDGLKMMPQPKPKLPLQYNERNLVKMIDLPN